MRLSELKILQASKKWKHFIYLTENQEQSTFTNTALNLTFDSMQVFVSALPPPSVSFTSGKNNMSLANITTITDEPHILGDILTFTCNNGEQFTIIAQ